MVKKIQNNNMDEALQAKAAVVDFSAVWCGPCQMLAPVLEELSGDLDGKVAFYNADTDENTQLAIANGITNIPALFFSPASLSVSCSSAIRTASSSTATSS